MKIYGVAILAGCFLAGQLLGNLIGNWVDVPGNMGGVAFAMFFLILINHRMKKGQIMSLETESGILFWNAMYIPIVIAMSATQNVKAALTGGWVAVAVGILATSCCLSLVPLISRLAVKKDVNDLENRL